MIDKRAQDRIRKAEALIASLEAAGTLTPKLQEALEYARRVIKEEHDPVTQKGRAQVQLDARKNLADIEELIEAANRDPLKNAETLDELQRMADEARELIC